MSITRAQQAKQMLQNGGRIGLRFGNRGPGEASRGPQGPAGGASAGGNYGGNRNPSQDYGGRDASDDFGQFERRQRQNQALQGAGFLGKDLGMNIGEQDRLAKFGDFIKGGGIIGNLLSGIFSGGTGKAKPPSFQGGGGGGSSQAMASIPIWMQLGFNSEAEYLASLQQDEDKDKETEEGLRLAFRADGGPIGGEYDFESARQMYGLGKLVKKVTKTVKKIAKSPVGKAALFAVGANYAPTLFGKQTILGQIKGAGGLSPFLFGAPKSMIAGPIQGLLGTGSSGTMGLLGKLGLTKGAGSMALTGKGIASLIGGTSVLGALLTPEQEEEAQELSRGEGIDIDAARRSILARAQGNIPSDFRATAFRAEGSPKEGEKGIMKMASAPDPIDALNDMAQMLFGKNLDQLTSEEYDELQDAARDAMAEGGKPEPVAKKTMPLLDMGGKEMDLRDNGGFVPIGRMEKADDVPARLSKNEFVFTADAVRNAGDGNVDKGAEVMYNMMKNLEAGGEVSEESQGLEGARKMFQTSQRLEEVL